MLFKNLFFDKTSNKCNQIDSIVTTMLCKKITESRFMNYERYFKISYKFVSTFIYKENL